jgi:hypothetical protein
MHHSFNVEGKGSCLFLTLFPTSLSVQFTIILSCYEHRGWYPTTMILHPERYEVCTHHTLYVPLPQDRVQHSLAQGVLPLLDDLIEVTLVPDPHYTLAWYQVQCTA